MRLGVRRLLHRHADDFIAHEFWCRLGDSIDGVHLLSRSKVALAVDTSEVPRDAAGAIVVALVVQRRLSVRR